MSFAFATCERNRALEFIRKLHPKQDITDTPETAGDFLDIIEADELRVCDPDCHGGQIIIGTNFNGTTQERAVKAMNKAGLIWGVHPDQKKQA